MAENFKDTYQEGGEAAGVRIFILSCPPIGVALRCRDMGGYPPHETGPEGFPRPGDVATDRVDSTAEDGWKVGVHLEGGGERGGGF